MTVIVKIGRNKTAESPKFYILAPVDYSVMTRPHRPTDVWTLFWRISVFRPSNWPL